MDNTSNHNNTWSDADIRKYLQGELSSGEMHALERAALDDPFLADALEGLAATTPLEADMDDLRSRLAARVARKEQRPAIIGFRRPGFRVAAALILLLGIGLTAYFTLLDHEQKPEAFTTVPKSAPAIAPSPQTTAPATVTDSTSVVLMDKKPAPAINRQPARTVTKKLPPPATDTLPAASYAQTTVTQPAPGLSINKDTSKTPVPAPEKSEVAKNDADVRASAASQSMFRSFRSPAANAQPLVLSGRVVDNNNRPLAGASLILNSSPRIGTRTDAAGNYNFSIRPRDTAQQMTVSLPGYTQTLVSLNPNTLTNNVIQLQEAKSALNEVVVTGFGAKRKETYAAAPFEDRDERLDSVWIKVYPVIGRLAYQQYLDTAKRSLNLDSTVIGTERVSFQVDQKGQISEFKIEQSLSPAHDAGTIQLISSGPAWKLLRGKKARALVSVNFP
jgi:hypothetical protein